MNYQIYNDEPRSKKTLARKKSIDSHMIQIAVGVGSGLGKVKNKPVSWRRLKQRLAKPMVDTSVSLAQYLALDTDKKLEKKRAPGNWTAAKYKGTSRKVDQVVGKSCVVLDLDYVTQEQLDFIQDGIAEVNQFAWFMHTSRSHIPEAPRWRMVVPTSRLMSPEEAHAITRLLALYLAPEPDEAIEIPDLVSFRTNQTMFWPSISDGQEFKTDENVTSILDVDEFLEKHDGWDDFENLPYQIVEQNRGKIDPNKRMEDPREKQEPIGSWCRVYTIEDAIETFLDDIYLPGDSDTETRYSYAHGTGSNGAVVYNDGLFLHSNHGTDPIEGSANAWDLVRIHKFGHLDKDAHSNTSPGNMPSYKAMVLLAQKDPKVAAEEYAHLDDQLDDLPDDDEDDDRREKAPTKKADPEVADLLGDTLDDLPDDDEEDAPRKPKKKKADFTWTTEFRKKANGDLEPVLHNITKICENDTRIAPCLGYNEFTLNPVALKPLRSNAMNLPSDEIEGKDKERGFRRWNDADDISVKRLCSAPPESKGWGTEFPSEKIMEAVLIACKQNSFHPIRDRMEAAHLKYVESGRKTKGAIEQIPQKYLGCANDAFHRESSKMMMLAIVARTFKPGSKFDCVPIFKGGQGGGKGRFFRVLSFDYFSNVPNDFRNTAAMVEAMQGALIAEMGEMSGLKRETMEEAKEFITRHEDQIRLAYGRRPNTYPRRGILVGSTNRDDVLHDPTGNRRFWVWVDTHDEANPMDLDGPDGLVANLDMLYGEAVDVYLEMRKEKPEGDLWLDLRTPEARAGRDKMADAHRALSVGEGIAELAEVWLDKPVPASEAMVDEEGLTVIGYEDDETPMLRNMITTTDVRRALEHHPDLSHLNNPGPKVFGRAMPSISGWHLVGKVVRHESAQVIWYARDGSSGDTRCPRWIPAPEPEDTDNEIDDLLG